MNHKYFLIVRRALSVSLLLLATSPSPPLAAGKAAPLLIGISTDASGIYADSGASERRGIEMAIREFNEKGGVLGRRIETVHIDSRSDAATAPELARRFIEDHRAAFLIGAVHSGFAAAFSAEAQRHGVIFLNTNSSSPSEAGKNCHRSKFVWDGNGNNFTKATIKNAVRWIGRRWVLLTHDYEWGHTTAAVTRRHLAEAGGTVVKELLVPEDVTDFTPYLDAIRALKPNVVATAVGGRSLQLLQNHVRESGQGRHPAWLSNQQDWPDVWLSGNRQELFGVFGTTWYHKFKLPGVSEFVAGYQATYPDSPIPVPGNVFYNGYMATKALFNAVEKAGTTNNHAVIRVLETLKVPAVDRMQHHDGFMDPDTHHFQQTIYMATANPQPSDAGDLFSIISSIPPQEIADRDDDNPCVLESFETTPVYEP